jgi:transposase
MDKPSVRRLSDTEKDALILDQAALIGRLVARITELEALVGKVRSTRPV